MRTRIKICGITKPADASRIVDLGVDAIGLVFYPKSPRAVDIGTAKEICTSLPALVACVAVFVDATPNEIERVLSSMPITLLQFHGQETATNCEQYGIPYIKAVRMKQEISPESVAESHPNAKAILLDSYHKGKIGGTGESFEWERVLECKSKPIILAGGLSPLNIAEAMTITKPYGIDVSTGVEIRPGIKDEDKLQNLVAAARECDNILSSGMESSRMKR